MKNPWLTSKSSFNKVFQIPKVNLGNLMLIEKRTIYRWFFYLGIFFAFYGTLNPWFMWKFYRYHVLFAFAPIAVSLCMSRGLSKPLFDRQDYIYPTCTCVLVLLSMAMMSGKNINGIFMIFFSAVIYFSLFRLNRGELQRLGDYLTTLTAGILAVSIPLYLMYLAGYPLPHYHVAPADMYYSYENYYLFLVDDRFFSQIIPRFHSVFLEPSHLGMTCITLLYCQIGKWNTWRCRVLFLALLMSFSLAAYLCLVALLFSSAWVKGKAILGKIVLMITLCSTIVVGSVFYNRGDNLVNNLIVQRLSPDSETSEVGGEDTRSTGVFKKEFDKMIDNGEWIFGKGMDDFQRFGFGNSGYRVFIYCYGAISILFVVVFFFTFLRTSDNIRAVWSVVLISAMSFIPHGIPVKFYFFIPLYIFAFSKVRAPQKNSAQVIEN